MDRFREQITKKVQQLGESFSSEDNVKVLLDDMSDYVISSYDAPTTSGSAPEPEIIADSKIIVTPKKSKINEEEEVINSIDAAYFIDHDEFDAIDYELKKLCDIEMCYEDIQRERLRLKNQHTVVSKRISSLIMQKSPSYSGQIGEMEKIHKELAKVLLEVLKIRRSLSLAKTQSETCLGIIANEKKKTMLKTLKKTLEMLKMFYESEQNIREIIENSANFPLAIQLLIETQIAASSYKHFTCVNDVMEKLAGMSTLLETELEKQLLSISVVFDLEKYQFVFTAYEMLDKIGIVPEKIAFAFETTIQTTSTAVILDKLSENERNGETASFLSFCLKFDNEKAVIAFREIGFVFCRTFQAFHSILRFHLQDGENENSQKIYKSLLNSRCRLFEASVVKILDLIESRDFVTLKFEQILEIADLINRLKSIGRTYFGYIGTELVEAIEKRITGYFERYHRERMEELTMFIENESFTVCPVPFQFTIFDLQDFEFLKEAREELDTISAENNAENAENCEEIELMGAEWQNPFSQASIKSRHQSTQSSKSRTFSSSSENIAENPSDDNTFTEEPGGQLQAAPNLCNTALNLLRFFGRYIRMTALLPSICDKSSPAIIELFEYFLASMCHIFSQNAMGNVSRIDRLAECLENIKKTFRNVNFPSICPNVQIEFIDNLYGACERVIAIDSIEFVARQLDLIRPVLESLFLEDVKEEILAKLEGFYSQVLPCSSDAKCLIIDASASRSLRLKTLVEMVSAVKWDINELKSQHSGYVDFLIQDFEVFALRLNALGENSLINLSENVKKFWWQRTIFYAFKALVQGYGDGGKCSTEGRALMQLDFQNILMKLEPLCAIKPVPHAGFVDGYIKAYYLPENGLEQWIKNHSEYSSKQLTSLLGAAAHVSKKARIRILDALKDSI